MNNDLDMEQNNITCSFCDKKLTTDDFPDGSVLFARITGYDGSKDFVVCKGCSKSWALRNKIIKEQKLNLDSLKPKVKENEQ